MGSRPVQKARGEDSLVGEGAVSAYGEESRETIIF
jgi:hypothetical protein